MNDGKIDDRCGARAVRDARVRPGLSEQAGEGHRAVHAPAARPTSSRAPSGRSCRRCGVSRWSSRIAPGAGGTIGAGVVAKSPPDGYTLIVHSAAHAVNAVDLPEAAVRHAEGLRRHRAARRPAQRARRRARDGIQDVGRARRCGEEDARRAQLSRPPASAAARTSTREKFKLAAGIDVVHIPYKGTPEAMTDTMTGRVTYFFSPISAALPNMREGKLVRARRVDREALERAAERADDRRNRAARIRLQPVGRHVGAGGHAGGRRRQDQRGRRQRRSRCPTCASGSRHSAPSRC